MKPSHYYYVHHSLESKQGMMIKSRKTLKELKKRFEPMKVRGPYTLNKVKT